jgi:hypothetical protein
VYTPGGSVTEYVPLESVEVVATVLPNGSNTVTATPDMPELEPSSVPDPSPSAYTVPVIVANWYTPTLSVEFGPGALA